MIQRMRITTQIAPVLVMVLVISHIASACSIPVFRYARDRWNTDLYRVTIFHDGPIEGDNFERCRTIAAESRVRYNAEFLGEIDDQVETANISVGFVDVTGEMDPVTQRLWKAQRTDNLPWVDVRYPKSKSGTHTLFRGPLGAFDVALFCGSPVLEETDALLAGGASAVWVFLESGDGRADRKAVKRLRKALEKSEEEIELPKIDQQDAEEYLSSDNQPALRIDFPMVTLKRNEKEDAGFIHQLIRSEPALAKYLDKPLAFPVFGKARILYALAGEGINTSNVKNANSFLCGPCACTIKEQNPGIDLLVRSAPEPEEEMLEAAASPKKSDVNLQGFGAFLER